MQVSPCYGNVLGAIARNIAIAGSNKCSQFWAKTVKSVKLIPAKISTTKVCLLEIAFLT